MLVNLDIIKTAAVNMALNIYRNTLLEARYGAAVEGWRGRGAAYHDHEMRRISIEPLPVAAVQNAVLFRILLGRSGETVVLGVVRCIPSGTSSCFLS